MRYTCLDGLRGVLAVYVMLGHMALLMALPAPFGWVPGLFAHGQACVDVFFILSGLVIGQSLASAPDRARFLAGRARRLLPTFFVVFACAVSLALLPPVWPLMPWTSADAAHHIFIDGWPAHGLAEIAAHVTMTHGLIPVGVSPYVWVSFLGAAWSLSTEWQFYALMAAGVRRHGVYVALAAAGLGYAALAPEAWQFSRAFLPNKAAFFALGLVSLPVLRDGFRAGGGRYWPVLGLCAGIAWAGSGEAAKILPPLLWTACLALQRRPQTWAGRALRSRPLLWLGAISYPLYLVNEPAQRLVAQAWAHAAGGGRTVFMLGWVPLASGLPVLAAWWLHRTVEVPGLRIGRAGRRASGVSPAGSSVPRG